MKYGIRVFVEWTLLAGLVGLMAGLAILYPSSLWAGDDYSLEYLAAACNAGARLNDNVLYKTGTMAYHPAVQFYIFSWLAAFAALGRDAIGSDLKFFDRLIDNAPALFVSLKICAIALTGALVIFYRRTASNLVPASILLIGIALYFATTPQTIFRSVYPLTETFSLAVNALFLIALVQMAKDPLRALPYVFCGVAAAFAYLLKVSFLYVYIGLSAAFAYLALFHARSWAKLLRGFLLSYVVGIGLVLVVGFYVIGAQYFMAVLRLHWAIFTHGAGSEANASVADVVSSILADWQSGATAIPLVLFFAPLLLIAVVIGSSLRRISVFAGAIAVGAAFASISAVAAVLTRYGPTYVVGVAGTIPLLFVSAWIVAADHRSRAILSMGALAVLAFSAWRSVPETVALFRDKMITSEDAIADAKAIERHVSAHQTGLFLYRVSMAGYGKGYVAFHCEVPAITEALLAANRSEQSSMARSAKDPNYVVADRNYTPTEAGVRSGKNLDPINAVQTAFHDGDEIIGLSKVWLLIRRMDPVK